EERPVVLDRLVPITADERVDDLDAETRRRLDHLLEMLDDAFAMRRIGMQRIGIVAEPGDLHAGLADEPAHARDDVVIDVGDVDVRDARVAPISAARRPAHHLNAAETLAGGEGEDLVEGEIGQDGADEAELHGNSPWLMSEML